MRAKRKKILKVCCVVLCFVLFCRKKKLLRKCENRTMPSFIVSLDTRFVIVDVVLTCVRLFVCVYDNFFLLLMNNYINKCNHCCLKWVAYCRGRLAAIVLIRVVQEARKSVPRVCRRSDAASSDCALSRRLRHDGRRR